MKFNRKSLISWLLVLSLMFGMLSVQVLAADAEETKIAAQQVVLGDGLTMRFLVSVEDAYKDTAVMDITVAGKTYGSYNISAMTAENGYYIFPVELAAAQMTDVIVLTLKSGDAVLTTNSFTLRSYALALIASGSFSHASKALAKHMLNYGAKAQTFFNYDAPANEGYRVEAAAMPAEAPETVITGKVEGISFSGASLLLRDKVAMRYYFSAPKGVGNYTFTVAGKTYEAVEKDGAYYVEIPGMAPAAYSDVVEMTVSDGENTMTVGYSAMHYMVGMYNKSTTDASLKQLLQAMMGYYNYAEAYVAEDTTIQLTTDSGEIILETIPTDDWNN